MNTNDTTCQHGLGSNCVECAKAKERRAMLLTLVAEMHDSEVSELLEIMENEGFGTVGSV